MDAANALPGVAPAPVSRRAGAGIAATFNTPIGGVLFATELMMPEVKRKNAAMALVIPHAGRPQGDRIPGVITKEQIANSVAGSIGLYPR